MRSGGQEKSRRGRGKPGVVCCAGLRGWVGNVCRVRVWVGKAGKSRGAGAGGGKSCPVGVGDCPAGVGREKSPGGGKAWRGVRARCGVRGQGCGGRCVGLAMKKSLSGAVRAVWRAATAGWGHAAKGGARGMRGEKPAGGVGHGGKCPPGAGCAVGRARKSAGGGGSGISFLLCHKEVDVLIYGADACNAELLD